MTRVRVNEGSTGLLTGTLVDASGVAVPQADVSQILLSLFDLDSVDLTVSPTQGILNGRLQVDITDEVVVDATTGAFTWVLQPDDNVILNARRQVERHRALVTVSYGATGSPPGLPAQALVECEIEVLNLQAMR